MVFRPTTPPVFQNPEVQELARYITTELNQISRQLSETTELDLRTIFKEPTRPRDGMVVNADGTGWDPGEGPGTYVRENGAWVKKLGVGDLFTSANKILYTDGAGDVQEADISAAGLALLDDADAAAQRATLGLGSIAVLNSIGDANYSGSPLSVANGGTGETSLSALKTQLNIQEGRWDLISTFTSFSSTSSIEFLGLSSSYLAYKFFFWNLIPVTTNVALRARLSDDNGSTFEGSGYLYGATMVSSGAVFSAQASAGGTQGSTAFILLAYQVPNTAGRGAGGEFTLLNPAASAYTSFLLKGSVGNGYHVEMAGDHSGTSGIDGIEFYFSSGNFSDSSGGIAMAGLRA